MMDKRSKLVIYLDVLSVIGEGEDKPTRIMYNANISWKPLQETLDSLLKQELIEVKNIQNHKRYKITPKGRKLLKYFRIIQKELYSIYY